jgi:hypothetical protein
MCSQDALKLLCFVFVDKPGVVRFYVPVVVNTNLQLNMSKCDFCANGRLSVWPHGIDRAGNVEGNF